MVKKNEKLRKVAFIVSILAVVSISVFLIGKSFAFFNYRKNGETVNVVTFKGLNVNILNSSDNALNLSGAYPIYDAFGLDGTPFEFEISNVSSQNIDYILKIENDADKQNACEVDGAVCPKLSTNYIKYAYKIGDGEYSTPTNLGENNDIVFSNTINGGSTIRVSLLIWIDQDAPNDTQGKYFFGKLILEANKSGTSYAIAMEGTNVTFSSNSLSAHYGSTEEVTITPAPGSYINGGSCTNGYTITGLTTGTSATTAQTITINNNNRVKGSTCTITTSTMGYDVALEGSNITFGANPITVGYGNISTVTVEPTSEYYITGATCTNGYTITGLSIDQNETGSQTITINNNNQLQSSTCTFTTAIIPGQFKRMLLADNEVITTPLTSSQLQAVDTTNNTGKIYKMSVTNSFGGGSGDTYFFRGDVTNNVVDFAGLTWRVVRINEDDTVRLILDSGINSNGTYTFNSTRSSYTYMYYSNSESYLKKTVDDWYTSNITGANATKVASGNYFCEAAKVRYNSNYTSGSATMTVYTSYTPTLDCTTDGNTKGLVNASAGLLTYDEVVLAGGIYGTNNQSYYLYKNASGGSNSFNWWIMSPAGYYSYARAWYIYSSGYITNTYVNSSYAVRPVINLKADLSIVKNESTGHYVVQ